MPSSEFARGSFYVAAAYALGIIFSILSRALVDWLSEIGPRGWVFSLCAHIKIDDLLNECNSDPKFARDLELEKTRGWRFYDAAKWNAAYRSAVRRTSRGQEVDRRRAQGRLVRNLFFPVITLHLLMFHGLLQAIIGFVAAAVIMLLLYAYAEYINFAEAFDINSVTIK